jgi:uncharacterized membrane protein YfhO
MISIMPNQKFLFFQTELSDDVKKSQPRAVLREDQEVLVENSSSNHLTIKTFLKEKKFLVWHNAYHKDWTVNINDEPKRLWRANVAFKGVWVPAGEHIVHFQFGSPWRFIMKYSYLILFAVVFFLLVIAWLPLKKGQKA